MSVSWHQCDTCCRKNRPWQLVLWKEKFSQKQEESLNRGQVTSVCHSISTFFSSNCPQGAKQCRCREGRIQIWGPVPGLACLPSEQWQDRGAVIEDHKVMEQRGRIYCCASTKFLLPCLLALGPVSRQESELLTLSSLHNSKEVGIPVP